MEIRRKLTYQFIVIEAIILLFSSIAIYVSFSESRKEEFYSRLESKSRQSAQMLIEIDEIDTELLRKIEKNNPLSLPNERIIIYDNQNKKIFSNDTDNNIKITDKIISELYINNEVKLVQKPFEIYGRYYNYENDKILVFVAAKDIFGMNKLYILRIILVLVFIAGLFVVYFSGRLFAARALLPISKIVSQVEGITVSNLNTRVAEGNGKDEIAVLANTFNKMLDRLETAFNIQKNFIANASHELRTPLTVLTGQLEVVLMTPREREEYVSTLNSVLSEIKNLNNISNRLLLLAQTSSDFAGVNFIPTRIDEALWQARNELIKRNPDYNIQIYFGENIDDESKFLIFGNTLLIKTAISNLMDNACKYSEDKTVNVNLDSDSKNLHIRFTDKGIGISKEEEKMIFQPFYRSKKVISIKGHGIGLSLVEKILILHNGTIEISSRLGHGSMFTISIPIIDKADLNI